MRNVLNNILIAGVVLSLTCVPMVVNAMPEPVPAGQTDKQKAAAAKAKEKEKAAKAKEKEKAAKAKEKEKAAKAKEKEKAAKAKENAKKQAERDKAAAERAKVAEQRAEAQAKKEAETKEKEEKAIRDYEKYQASLENPKTEAISYFNLGLRLGYAAMMDKITGSYMGAGTLNQSNVYQQLKGGPGAGLNFTYNLEYGHFLFEVGLDARFLNSTSSYGFQIDRKDLTYPYVNPMTGVTQYPTYSYLFDNLTETRNMLEVGVPVMFGAQFSRYYFLLGAKVHYGLPMGYSQKGLYDIVVNDPALVDPYGMGIHEINGTTNQAIQFRQPDISVAAEVGIDLDEWLQAQPKPADKKDKKKQVKPGQRLPFGPEHVHYRLGLFAEYGVLNTNNTPAKLPADFSATEVKAQSTNTLLALNGNTKLNNLFVGAKFTIQFEVPGKKARPVPPPASYAIYSVVDAVTNEPLKVAFVETRGTESGKIAMRDKQIGPKGFKQKHAVGAFTAEAKADGYYPTTFPFEIEKVGSTEYVTIALRPMPVLRVRVTNKETGLAIPATVQILRSGVAEPAYSLATDSATGTTRQMLEEGPQYRLHIAQMGYDTLDMVIPNIGDSLNVQLTPIKKGEVFIVKNLFFATNKTRILKTSEEALNDLYMYLARNPQVRIRIIGHTDSVGKDEANQKLSDGRANEVMKDLIERGISADRLEAEGRGESQPIDTNDTEEGRQNNRRVEIEIL